MPRGERVLGTGTCRAAHGRVGVSTCDEPSRGGADTRLRVHRCPEMQSDALSQAALGLAGAGSCPHPLPKDPTQENYPPRQTPSGRNTSKPMACSPQRDRRARKMGGKVSRDPRIARQPRWAAGDQNTSSGTHWGPHNIPPKITQSPLTTQPQRASCGLGLRSPSCYPPAKAARDGIR